MTSDRETTLWFQHFQCKLASLAHPLTRTTLSVAAANAISRPRGSSRYVTASQPLYRTRSPALSNLQSRLGVFGLSTVV